MPFELHEVTGCRSYAVRATPGDEDSLESVRATIARARPLIASKASR
jgi:hypothetical protein